VRKRDTNAFAREQPRQRRAKTLTGTNDQGVLVFRHFHGVFLDLQEDRI